MIEPIARVRFDLLDVVPKIWRRVDVPLSATLLTLHDIVQVTMRWHDAHLFEFRIGDKIYGEPSPDDAMYERKVYHAKSIRLKTVVERGVDQFPYAYDFGDNWQLDITIETVGNGEPIIDYPAFVDGARRAPPEDVGGPGGFMDFLDAVTDPLHEEHQRMLDWYGTAFNPDDIDEQRVRMVVSWFAARRRGPLASHRSERRRATR